MPQGHIHSSCFLEAAILLKHSFDSLGMDCDMKLNELPKDLINQWLSFAGIRTHQLALAKNVAFHGGFNFLFGFAGRQIQQYVKRVYLEEITVGSGRRAGTAISDTPEIGHPLPAAAGQRISLGHILGQAVHGWGDIVAYPMHPGANRRIGIIAYQRNAFGTLRNPLPRKRRRYVCAITRELGWNGFTLLEC